MTNKNIEKIIFEMTLNAIIVKNQIPNFKIHKLILKDIRYIKKLSNYYFDDYKQHSQNYLDYLKKQFRN